LWKSAHSIPLSPNSPSLHHVHTLLLMLHAPLALDDSAVFTARCKQLVVNMLHAPLHHWHWMIRLCSLLVINMSGV